VFIGDLVGEHEPLYRAGIIHPDNWTARLPDDFEACTPRGGARAAPSISRRRSASR
jgi:hypothetical protein